MEAIHVIHAMSINNIIRYTFKLFCFIGCILHMHSISESYLKFETITEVKYENEAIFSLPGITICFSKSYAIRNETMLNIETNTSQKFNVEKTLNYLNEMSINDQMQALYSPQEILKELCWVKKPIGLNFSEDYIECNRITNYRYGISFYDYCFAIFSQLNGETDDKYLIDYDVNILGPSPNTLCIILPTKSDSFYLHLHNRKIRIRNVRDFGFKFLFRNKNLKKIAISYTKTMINRMPKPFNTACIEYSVYGYESRFDCISKCKINNYIAKSNKYPGNYLVYDNMLQFGEFLNNIIDAELSEKCNIIII